MLSRTALRELVFRLATELALRVTPRDATEYLSELITDGLREGGAQEIPDEYMEIHVHDEPEGVQ